jgi:hypothetical protein
MDEAGNRQAIENIDHLCEIKARWTRARPFSDLLGH